MYIAQFLNFFTYNKKIDLILNKINYNIKIMTPLKLLLLTFSLVKSENIENCVIGEDCPCRSLPRVSANIHPSHGEDWRIAPKWANPCKHRSGGRYNPNNEVYPSRIFVTCQTILTMG